VTPTATLVPAAVFKPSLEGRYEVSVEEAVVYGTGGTMDGGQIELLLDLVIPDTGTDGPRPLFVHIHGGGFVKGTRWPQRDVAEKGWVAASIDYRLAGDEPLPGPRVKPFFDAIGGESSSARDRSVVASIEDTLVALDYLLSRANELNIDTNRIVLKGQSALCRCSTRRLDLADSRGRTKCPLPRRQPIDRVLSSTLHLLRRKTA
jgi:acetyl esterase/lipase